MPGPGHKGKSKPKILKPNQSSPILHVSPASSVHEAYVDDVDRAGGWTTIVNILCDVFELPDLSTRKGLKKIHANFDAVYRKLDNAYQKNVDNERIKGGIVGIYAKMSADSLLRNKLFHKGLLDKIFPLLQVESTRHMALQALITVTHHGGAEIRSSIATHSGVLTKLIENHPNDALVSNLTVAVLAHGVGAVVEGTERSPAYPKILKTLDMPRIIKDVVDCMKKSSVNRSGIDHGTELIASSTLHASSAFLSQPPATRFLVAGLRCKDWVLRCTCLGGLIRLHKIGSQDDQRSLDPHKLASAMQRGIPKHLDDAMIDYSAGPFACDIFLTLSIGKAFQSAMMTCLQDRDLYSLGLKLARFIVTTEFSISEGYFQFVNEKTGALELADVGLPFRNYSDALPHCAKAIRAKGKLQEADAADVLDIKYRIMRQRIPDAVDLANKALQRNPQFAYFYYAITLSADHSKGLRAAKKGMKCKITTPFVRFQMMQRAVEHAGDMGINILQQSPTAGERKWEEGIAFLMSALDDAKTYIEQAPPDNRHMKNVSYWYILLTILTAEELSPDLRELQGAFQTLKTADEFSTFIGVPPPKTILRLTQETVIDLFPAAVKEFSSIFDRACEVKKQPEVEEEKLKDDLASWLSDLHLVEEEEHEEMHCSHPTINANRVALYRCTHCGNPSAALRKCAGCAKARYCDSDCQKTHWSEHKMVCKTKTIAT